MNPAPGSSAELDVPSTAHYQREYLDGRRMHSIAEQVGLLLEDAPQSVLEIGMGTGITAFALRAAGVTVQTLDLQPDLQPDIVGDVRDIPADDDAFDAANCCQVLEHLPWAEFPRAIAELRRVTRSRLVVSLPDITRHVGVQFNAPQAGRRGGSFSLPAAPRSQAWRTARLIEMGHHWEIGLDGIGWTDVVRAIEHAGFARVTSHRLDIMPWHRFFVAD